MLLCLHVKELEKTENSEKDSMEEEKQGMEKDSMEEEKKGMEPLQQISSKWAYFMLSLVLIYAFVFTGEDT